MNKLPEEIIEKYFQSHFGLILSEIHINSSMQAYWLSIPFWSDFIASSIKALSNLLKRYGFQSHFGLILSRSSQRVRRPVVSGNFQSHFGLILSVSDEEKVEVKDRAFNPILV